MDVQHPKQEGENQEGEELKTEGVTEETTEENKQDEDLDYTEAVEESSEEDLEEDLEESTELTVAPSSSPNMVEGDYVEVFEANKALDAITNLAKRMIKGRLCPLRTIDDVVIAVITGKQYNFPFMTSINNIYPINGKPAMSTHLIRGMLIKAGVIIKKVHSFEPMYTYYKAKLTADGKIEINEEGKEVPIKISGVAIPLGNFTIKDAPDLAIKGNNAVDHITRFDFIRKIRMPDGTFETMQTTGSFTMSEAAKADLLDKDNWKKYPQRMLESRAFNFGAREIADDILLGIYSISELADINDVNYNIGSGLQEQVVVN